MENLKITENKKYVIKIQPEMLKLLGPQMYKNMYFILGELIANSWDADAENVYIKIEKNSVTIEDDGNGMSYKSGEITDKYLTVGIETRKNDSESLTSKFQRKKMGRKGIGKLAALALSGTYVLKTIKDGEKSGFILSTKDLDSTGKLQPIEEKDINFSFIEGHGTSIEMKNPKYITHKKIKVIAKNITRVFPFMDKNFAIHLLKDNDKIKVESSLFSIDNSLSTIITYGEEFEKYAEQLLIEESKNRFAQNNDEIVIDLKGLKNKNGAKVDKNLVIKGWVGTYKETKGRKKDILDFPDNFISVYSNKKIGEFNILDKIGKNTVTESYVVGELHVDLLEDSDLDDIASSDRTGYLAEDIRYTTLLKESRAILDNVIKMRRKYADFKNKSTHVSNMRRITEKEERLKKLFGAFRNSFFKKLEIDISHQIKKPRDLINRNKDNFDISSQRVIKLMARIDAEKKKILISHSSKDIFYCDLIYDMLVRNNFPKREILYTNSENEESRVHRGSEGLFEYLKTCFVKTLTNQGIYVVYVTSNNLYNSWSASMEVGAGWITKSQHQIFHILNGEQTPKEPLNVSPTWNEVSLDYENKKITFTKVQLDDFCGRIEDICKHFRYVPQSRDENKKWLSTLVDIV